MKAVFHTGVHVAWGDVLGDRPWCLAPVGGKPLIEYWLEWAVELGVDEVRLVLGDGAYDVEAYCGDGSRWGLKAEFGFLKSTAVPEAYLRRSPDIWSDGLLYICGPVFPGRTCLPPWPKPADGTTWMLQNTDTTVACLLSRQPKTIEAFLKSSMPPATGVWADLALAPSTINNIKSYYDLNMRLVGGESARYVPPGYSSRDGASIGYNVLIPPSVELRAPLTIGNDCRIHPMAVVGPNAVIGSHVIIDQQTELSECVVLDGTYLGRNLEINGRIVSGTRIISPVDGSVVEIAEPWLIAQLKTQSRGSDFGRGLAGWVIAVCLIVLQAIPFILLYPLLRWRGIGRYRRSTRIGPRDKPLRIPVWMTLNPQSRLGRAFVGLSLDLFPLVCLAGLGRLWLCGHAPLHPERDQPLRKRLLRYFPAAICYFTRRSISDERETEIADALYYERYRSIAEDLRIVLRTLVGRFLDALSGDSGQLE